jgi:phosphoglycolate phosphatase-like HAD superfamily hydrolase
MPRAAILDIDGTLVDTNYQHANAWYRAFRQNGIVLPVWRIHRAIGMGGDQLVPHFIGEERDAEVGDDLRSAEKALFLSTIQECSPFEGARDLIVDLKDRGSTVILASSAKAQELDHYLDLLDVREIVDDWTTSADVEQTKPEPDLVKAALDADAVMVGDTPWDIKAARSAGIDTIAVMTGGFGHDELEEAGALAIFDSIDDLRKRLDETPLG